MSLNAFLRCVVVALISLFWCVVGFQIEVTKAAVVIGVLFSVWCLTAALLEAWPQYRAWRRWRREIKLIGDPNEVYCSCGYKFGSDLPHVQHNAPKESYEVERTIH